MLFPWFSEVILPVKLAFARHWPCKPLLSFEANRLILTINDIEIKERFLRRIPCERRTVIRKKREMGVIKMFMFVTVICYCGSRTVGLI